MKTMLIPQEIFLLERYTSIEYFEKLRNTWEEMILHLHKCLYNFMAKLPPNYRSRPISEQPDIVWGEHVIANFRDTFQLLCNGYIKLSHGEIDSLVCARAPAGDFKGQMDFWPGWMSKNDELYYKKLLMNSVTFSGNIDITERAYWDPKDLSDDYNINARGQLNPPEKWPKYQPRSDRSIESGSKVIYPGIYLPQIENSCAQFLSTNHPIAPEARIITGKRDLFNPENGKKYAEEYTYGKSPCVWTLVERALDSNHNNSQSTEFTQEPPARLRAGEICQKTGDYFTPAKANSRNLFNTGDVMPTFKTDYGAVIWQWDINQ